MTGEEKRRMRPTRREEVGPCYLHGTLGAGARLAAMVAALCLATFALTGACSSGATPICGPDAGCGPGPFSDTGVTGDAAVE
jgi:hypothetical protein